MQVKLFVKHNFSNKLWVPRIIAFPVDILESPLEIDPDVIWILVLSSKIFCEDCPGSDFGVVLWDKFLLLGKGTDLASIETGDDDPNAED